MQSRLNKHYNTLQVGTEKAGLPGAVGSKEQHRGEWPQVSVLPHAWNWRNQPLWTADECRHNKPQRNPVLSNQRTCKGTAEKDNFQTVTTLPSRHRRWNCALPPAPPSTGLSGQPRVVSSQNCSEPWAGVGEGDVRSRQPVMRSLPPLHVGGDHMGGGPGLPPTRSIMSRSLPLPPGWCCRGARGEPRKSPLWRGRLLCTVCGDSVWSWFIHPCPAVIGTPFPGAQEGWWGI